MTAMNEREACLTALAAWVRQRPGLEFANYGNAASYRAELRGITRDRHDAETLLKAVAYRETAIPMDALRDAFRAYSGRLSWHWDGQRGRLEYCTGQYWPTEYRRAVCAVLASALWACWREECRAERKIGDAISARARREFGRGLAGRWFR